MEATSQRATAANGLPPGPRWPRAAQTAWYALRPTSVLRRCHARYGDAFTLRTHGLGEMVFLADPAAVKEVFTGDRDLLHAGEANAAMEPVLGPHSLLLLDGARHLRERKLLLPAFHGEAVRAYADRIEEIAEREVAGWPVAKPFAVRPRMQAVTLEVILQAVIGVRDPARLDRLRRLLPQLLDFSVSDMWAVWIFPGVMNTFLGRRHKAIRVQPEVDRLLLEEIADHRRDPEGRDDVLALLVAARDEGGEPLSDRALRDHVVTLLLAGHETTTTALAWAFERLVRHPAALARLRDEVRTGEGDDYLRAVVDETLRVRPIIWGVWRRLTAPAEVAGHRLPAGTTVEPSISLLQESDAFEHPQEFRPERFLDGASPPPYTFIPFGGGPRRCIGASFATMEMRAVLRTVLRSVDLATTTARPEQPRVHHVTLVPSRGGRISVERRVVGG
ncbi:MAG TPA: cytochrome P450 [Thermoleophilaceae bacterium]|nr:cytochrome P450 [Thermoleophilaceae bacterium]